MAAEALRVCGVVELFAREGARALEGGRLMVGKGRTVNEGNPHESLQNQSFVAVIAPFLAPVSSFLLAGSLFWVFSREFCLSTTLLWLS